MNAFNDSFTYSGYGASVRVDYYTSTFSTSKFIQSWYDTTASFTTMLTTGTAQSQGVLVALQQGDLSPFSSSFTTTTSATQGNDTNIGSNHNKHGAISIGVKLALVLESRLL
jgi:hypothetical protein